MLSVEMAARRKGKIVRHNCTLHCSTLKPPPNLLQIPHPQTCREQHKTLAFEIKNAVQQCALVRHLESSAANYAARQPRIDPQPPARFCRSYSALK